MAALALMNPRKARARRSRKSGSTKRRRPMTAEQLKFFGPRKVRKSAARKAARKAKPEVLIVNANPKGKVMAKKARRHRRRKAKVFTHPAKRVRRNPRAPGASFLNNTIFPAMIGAGGAIAADYLLGLAPIPVQFKTGVIGIGFKITSALLVGAAVGAVFSREAGEEAAAGGVITTIYGVSRGFLAQRGANGAVARYVPALGRYVPMNGWSNAPLNRAGGRPGLGYMNPAPTSAARGAMRYMATR